MPAPIRMRIEVPGDLEAIRRWLLKLAPRMEAQQPGITEQLRTVDMHTPMRMVTPKGMVVLVQYEPRPEPPPRTAIKVQVDPPLLRGKLSGWWWERRTRWIVRLALKLIRSQLAREHGELPSPPTAGLWARLRTKYGRRPEPPGA